MRCCNNEQNEYETSKIKNLVYTDAFMRNDRDNYNNYNRSGPYKITEDNYALLSSTHADSCSTSSVLLAGITQKQFFPEVVNSIRNLINVVHICSW